MDTLSCLPPASRSHAPTVLPRGRTWAPVFWRRGVGKPTERCAAGQRQPKHPHELSAVSSIAPTPALAGVCPFRCPPSPSSLLCPRPPAQCLPVCIVYDLQKSRCWRGRRGGQKTRSSCSRSCPRASWPHRGTWRCRPPSNGPKCCGRARQSAFGTPLPSLCSARPLWRSTCGTSASSRTCLPKFPASGMRRSWHSRLSHSRVLKTYRSRSAQGSSPPPPGGRSASPPSGSLSTPPPPRKSRNAGSPSLRRRRPPQRKTPRESLRRPPPQRRSVPCLRCPQLPLSRLGRRTTGARMGNGVLRLHWWTGRTSSRQWKEVIGMERTTIHRRARKAVVRKGRTKFCPLSCPAIYLAKCWRMVRRAARPMRRRRKHRRSRVRELRDEPKQRARKAERESRLLNMPQKRRKVRNNRCFM
eukprot:Hpha_TRINITY_DN16459_c1_g5::TRINITY_DN16459_c1_g5_i1::g.162852::m.162852